MGCMMEIRFSKVCDGLSLNELGENSGSIGHRSCEKMIKEKTPLLDDFLCIQIGIKDF